MDIKRCLVERGDSGGYVLRVMCDDGNLVDVMTLDDLGNWLGEVNDILRCVCLFDSGSSLEEKGRYFDVIQRDIRIMMGKFNEGLVNSSRNITKNW